MNVKKASMIISRLSVIPFVFVMLVLPLCGAAFAEDFPTREIELVIGYAAGGAFLGLAYFDLPYHLMIIILLAAKFSGVLGTPVSAANPAADASGAALGQGAA